MIAMDVESKDSNTLGTVDVPVDYEPRFVRRDGGSALLKCGDNASTTLVGLPQRGPMRQDGLVTLQVTYSRGLVVRSRRTKKIGAVSAAKAALKTAQDMLILRPMAKSRIRLKVCNVQSGPSEVECAVNSTSTGLLQSSYDLKDVIAAVSYTRNAAGDDVFFPNEAVLHDSKKCRRPIFRFRFNVKLEVVWVSISGPSTAEDVRKAEEICRKAVRTVFDKMRQCAAGQ